MNQHSPSIGYLVVLLGAFVWCLLLFVPPVLDIAELPSSTLSHYAYVFFSSICHQYDSRSLHIAGHQLAVCSRCSGIYFGFFIGSVLVYFFLQKKSLRALPLLLTASLPMLIDVAVGVVGIHEPTLTTRLFTGLFFGIVTGVAFVPMLANAVSYFLSHRFSIQGVRYESET